MWWRWCGKGAFGRAQIEFTQFIFGLQLRHGIIGRFLLGHFDLHQVSASSRVLIGLGMGHDLVIVRVAVTLGANRLLRVVHTQATLPLAAGSGGAVVDALQVHDRPFVVL